MRRTRAEDGAGEVLSAAAEHRRLPLAATAIGRNLLFTAEHAWAWYRLAPQDWHFRSVEQRSKLLDAVTAGYAQLAGRRIRLRVTSKPYPVPEWARRLHANTPRPLPQAPGGESWEDYLRRSQQRIRTARLDEKAVYLGVRVGPHPGRAVVDTLRLDRRDSHGEYAGKGVAAFLADVRAVDDIVAGEGLAGARLDAAEMRWLMHRSIGLFCPVTAAGHVGGDWWDTTDLFEFTDPVAWEAEPYAPTVKVIAERDGHVHIRHVVVLTMGRQGPVRSPDGGRDPWLLFADRFPFPVEWSLSPLLLSGAGIEPLAEHTLNRAQNISDAYDEHAERVPRHVVRGIEQAAVVYDEATDGTPEEATRAIGPIRLAVAGDTAEQALERARIVTAAYNLQQKMALERPAAQHALVREFIPGEPHLPFGYQRQHKVRYLAAGMPNVASRVGDDRGPYIARVVGASRRAVMRDGHYGPEVLNTSALCVKTGGLGSGKSMSTGWLAYHEVRRGELTAIWDPSGPLRRLAELPELAPFTRVLSLTDAEPGAANPFVLVPDPPRSHYEAGELGEERWRRAGKDALAERRQLVLDTLRGLLPAEQHAAGGTESKLREAIRAAGLTPRTSPWAVVDALYAAGPADEYSRTLGGLLGDAFEMPRGRLIAGDRGDPVGEAFAADAMLTIVTAAGLTLPDERTERRHWSEEERAAGPLLNLGIYLTVNTLYRRPMHERKNVHLDEAHMLQRTGAGRYMVARFDRDNRKYNLAVDMTSQSPADMVALEVHKRRAAAFVGRMDDRDDALAALRLLGISERQGYEDTLLDLPTGEFVYRDEQGQVARIRFDIEDHYPEVYRVLDTRPRGATTPAATTAATDAATTAATDTLAADAADEPPPVEARVPAPAAAAEGP